MIELVEMVKSFHIHVSVVIKFYYFTIVLKLSETDAFQECFVHGDVFIFYATVTVTAFDLLW